MKQDLIKWGCIPRKSLKLEKIPDIPKELVKHFIRGLFDADGCISIGKRYKMDIHINLTGYKPFIEDINKFLVENDILDHYNKLHERNNNIVCMGYNGKYAVYFLNYIYKDIKIYLDRKYNKFYCFGC